MLSYEFMRLALAAAVLVGLTAPTVGVYLVQRRLSLIGDGLGHVALLGVAVGLVTRSAPVLTALLATVAGAVVVEVLRARRSASADIALAVMFYGGIAGGVVVVTRAPAGTPTSLDGYLFGALTTTTRTDLVVFTVLAAVVLGVTIGLGRSLFAVALDEEHARASGLPVLPLNLLLAVVTAATVTLSMRVLGLLLISGLMVLPAGCAQLVARSFRSSLVVSVLIGVSVAVSGTVVSWYADTPSGGTVVLMAVAAYAVLSIGRIARRRPPARPEPRTPAPPAAVPVGPGG
ncbi:metal ABC transporter permease [Modestobacter roseus]|uniref:metal ABC transporter permease n=1 Tax=Modestobacter roseus TaxID=1181884 RepID=UPI0034DEEF94